LNYQRRDFLLKNLGLLDLGFDRPHNHPLEWLSEYVGTAQDLGFKVP